MRIKIKKSLTIHPFLLAIFPFLFILSYNVEQITNEDIHNLLLGVAVTVCLAFLLWLLLSFILKDKKKAALIISLGLALFFSYGHLTSLVQGLVNISIGFHKVFLTLWGIVFLLVAYFILRMRRNLNTLTNLLNVIALALVIISLINIGAYSFRSGTTAWDKKIVKNSEYSTSNVNSSQVSPDIYYIILDGYASLDTLAKVYSYDNHGFYDYLTKRGFLVADKSTSNYQMTLLSLSSSLNMEYINNLADIVGIESKEIAIPYQMIKESKVMNFLKSRGYKFIHFSSGWWATNRNQLADIDIRCGRLNEMLVVLIKTTMAGLFMNYMQDDHSGRILCTFSKLADVPTIEGPKFIFCHITSPHPPYVFGRNGEPVPEAKLEMAGSVWEQRELYLNQLIFITKKVETLVDELLSESEVPPIIILQADHGTASIRPSEDSEYSVTTDIDRLRERFGIFNAYYLPQVDNSVLYNSITPVNTFRIIFNLYFGTNYELLSDYCFYSTYDRPYDFTDVTDKVR